MRILAFRTVHYSWWGSDLHAILVSGMAGLVAGAMSMAAGEYVSVSSQADIEQADLKRETFELAEDHAHEVQELKAIYVERGLKPELAQQVAEQLMLHDALAAHARDELGLTDVTTARPLQAAFVSALTFSFGAFLPLLIVMLYPYLPWTQAGRMAMDSAALNAMSVVALVGTVSLLSLILLGGLSAFSGGTSVIKAIARVTFWGMLSMGITACIGVLFGAVSG